MIASTKSVSENHLPGTSGYHSVIHLKGEDNFFIETGELLDTASGPNFANLLDGSSDNPSVIGVSNCLPPADTDHVIIRGVFCTH